MTVSPGFSASEIEELVLEYERIPFGSKEAWCRERGIVPQRMRRWRMAYYGGDLERGLVPRKGVKMRRKYLSPSERLLADKEAENERLRQEIQRLNADVYKLEKANEILGKAIGLLHQLNEQEPEGKTPEQ